MVWARLAQDNNGAVRKSLAMQVDDPPRGRGGPKRTWMEDAKIDLKKCDLSEDLAQDRSEWRNITHVADSNMMMMYGDN